MLIWLTNVFNASPEQIIEDYGNRWLIETLFEEAKGEWYINEFISGTRNNIGLVDTLA